MGSGNAGPSLAEPDIVASQAESENPLLVGLSAPGQGVGPLLQRDYWGIVESCRVTPVALVEELRWSFVYFAPPEFVSFERLSGEGPLEVGDDLRVIISKAGAFGVRVVCRDPQTVTLATLLGHPESGRITFGAYRNEPRDVVFHIRSRARSSSLRFAMGYAALGEAVQTDTWADFIWAVSCRFGNGILGKIHAEKRVVQPPPGGEDACSPTFLAQGN